MTNVRSVNNSKFDISSTPATKQDSSLFRWGILFYARFSFENEQLKENLVLY